MQYHDSVADSAGAEEDDIAFDDEATPLGVVTQYFRKGHSSLSSPFKFEHTAASSDKDPFIGYLAPVHGSRAYKKITLTDICSAMYQEIGVNPATALQPFATASTDINTIFPAWMKADLSGYIQADSATYDVNVWDISHELCGLLSEPVEDPT